METKNVYGQQLYVDIRLLKIPEYYSKSISEEKKNVVKRSVERFGVKQALVVNENPERINVIIGGVLLQQIALEIGISELPVFYVDLDIEAEKHLSVMLDQRGTHALSSHEIIELIGNLSYENFFGVELQKISLEHHLITKESEVSNSEEPTKKSIKQLLIRLSDEDKLRYDLITKEIDAKTNSETLTKLMDLYENTTKTTSKSNPKVLLETIQAKIRNGRGQ